MRIMVETCVFASIGHLTFHLTRYCKSGWELTKMVKEEGPDLRYTLHWDWKPKMGDEPTLPELPY